MDLVFPTENDGFSALSRLRSAPRRSVPVIIVTQADRSDLKSAALHYGVNDYIIKPYQLKRLESSINSLIKTEKAYHYDTSAISDIKMSFDSYVEREIKYSKRTGAPMSLILITTLQLNSDTGTEKSVTDEYKASVFNIAAKKAREALRATDTIVLNHGRDIIIVLPCTDEAGARLVSEKIKTHTEPEFEKINSNRNEYIYPVYVAYPKDGDSFQTLMQTAFRRIADKEMLEKIISIPPDTRKYADKSYNRYRKWW
jgi:PleD family two-component response regulator